MRDPAPRAPSAAGWPSPFVALAQKREGVKRRKAPLVHALRRARPIWGRVAFQRFTAAISVPGAVASGREPGRLSASPIRQAFARLRPRRVQPSKAVPHSRDGRRPRASRGRGYEPRPQAPHPPRVMQRPAGRPSRGEGDGNI
jgi:hypothetical protein